MADPSPVKEPALVDIHQATIYRGRTCVFKDLSLTIEQGECVAILGPNGSGKTTLLKTINREVYPAWSEQSHVRILGRERWNIWELREHIGVVSHDLQQSYAGDTSGLEVVLSGFFSSIGIHARLGELVNEAQVEKADATLEKLGIIDLRDRSLKTMSTGQQRRCLLGRALVHEPKTLIFDEPTEGLDLTASFDYLARIRRLSRAGRNIVMVTHHINEIPPEINRVIILQEGLIVADGEKASVLTSERLSSVYRTGIRVKQVDGHFLAYPGD